jgi:hypothetical protein
MANGEVPTEEIIGRNRYAVWAGVTPGAVARAIKSGRITKSVIWGPGGRVAGIRWRQADELWARNTDVGRRPKTSPAAARVQTSAPPALDEDLSLSQRRILEQRQISEILAVAYARTIVPWAAMVCERFGVAPDLALNVIEDSLLCINDAVGGVLGIPAEDELQMFVPKQIDKARRAEGRVFLLERIKTAAQVLDHG